MMGRPKRMEKHAKEPDSSRISSTSLWTELFYWGVGSFAAYNYCAQKDKVLSAGPGPRPSSCRPPARRAGDGAGGKKHVERSRGTAGALDTIKKLHGLGSSQQLGRVWHET
jgi:hypothetical protein